MSTENKERSEEESPLQSPDSSFWEDFEVTYDISDLEDPVAEPKETQVPEEDTSEPLYDIYDESYYPSDASDVFEKETAAPQSYVDTTPRSSGSSSPGRKKKVKRKRRRSFSPVKSTANAGGKVAGAGKKAVRATGRTAKSGAGLLKKTGAATGRAAGSAAGSLLKLLLRLSTLLLIAITMVILARSFWNGHTVLGSPTAILAERNYTLAAYLGVGILLLFYELIAFFRALTGRSYSKNGNGKPRDTGRGWISFILLYLGSYGSNRFYSYLPDSPSVLSGFKQGLVLYGSLHRILFVLGIAGIISCIARFLYSMQRKRPLR